MPRKNSRDQSKHVGTVGTVSPYCTRSARAKESLGKEPPTVPNCPVRTALRRWAVCPFDPVIGIGRQLGTVEAVDHSVAESIAAERWPGRTLFVSLAGGRARREREHYHHHPSKRAP